MHRILELELKQTNNDVQCSNEITKIGGLRPLFEVVSGSPSNTNSPGPGPPGIPVLKVKNSPPRALKIPENSRCQKHYILVYLSILNLYWRCNLYVYLRTAAVVCVFIMAALCNRGAIIFLPCSFFPSFFFYLFFLA